MKTDPTTKITYETAKSYVTRGWPVFPVVIRFDDKGKAIKKPATPWGAYQRRLPTDDELHRWFDSGRYNGIGMATGKLSGVVVVDRDTYKGGTALTLSSPLVAKTISGGFHHYFRWTRELKNVVMLQGQPLDVRADGGFVVLPPSSFSGKSYAWMTETSVSALLPLPAEIERQLVNRKTFAIQPGEDLPFTIEGERNQVAARVAGVLVAGISVKLLGTVGWESFISWNQTHVTPPLDQGELRKIWESIVSTDVRTSSNSKNKRREHIRSGRVQPVDDIVNDISKRPALDELRWCNYRTSPTKIAELLSVVFSGCGTYKAAHWLYVAERWTPRPIIRTIDQVRKYAQRGGTIENFAALFTFKIRFRKIRRRLRNVLAVNDKKHGYSLISYTPQVIESLSPKRSTNDHVTYEQLAPCQRYYFTIASHSGEESYMRRISLHS